MPAGEQAEKPSSSGSTVSVTVKARQADDSGGTKTIRNADKTVSWMPREEILIICGDEKAKFTSINTENEAAATFYGEMDEATVTAVSNGTCTSPVWGLYPYDGGAQSDGTCVITTLPAEQTGVAGTFANNLFITLAQSANFNLYFYNVCSGFRFSVTKAGIRSVTLQGNDHEDIAGKICLRFADGRPQAEVIAGEKTITLVPQDSTFEVGKDYYFVMLPTYFSRGFTVSFETVNETGVFVYTAAVDFPRSSFISRSGADAEVTYHAKEGIRLMSYNVGTFSKYLGDSAPMIARIIEEVGAEVVALNELDSCNQRHPINQVQHLADELNALSAAGAPWSGCFSRAMAYRGGAYGNGIVTKAAVLDHFSIALPKEAGSEVRVCAVIETPHYVYAACHLDHRDDAARLTQAAVMTETLLLRYGDSRKPVFLAGDFNDTPDSPLIRQMSRNWTLLSPLENSFPASNPRICIDYIFLLQNRAAVQFIDGAVLTSQSSNDVTLASDHLPLFVEVVF